VTVYVLEHQPVRKTLLFLDVQPDTLAVLESIVVIDHDSLDYKPPPEPLVENFLGLN